MVTARGAEFRRGAGPSRVIRDGPVVIPARRLRRHLADAGGPPCDILALVAGGTDGELREVIDLVRSKLVEIAEEEDDEAR